jgi:uncharacterized protein (TIGR03067 family)
MQSLLVSALLVASAAPVPDTDAKKIEGEWRLISANAKVTIQVGDGGTIKIPVFLGEYEYIYSFSNGKLSVKSDGKQKYECKYKLINDSKDPKWIDLIESKKGIFDGIYKLEGDELTICVCVLLKRIRNDQPSLRRKKVLILS